MMFLNDHLAQAAPRAAGGQRCSVEALVQSIRLLALRSLLRAWKGLHTSSRLLAKAASRMVHACRLRVRAAAFDRWTQGCASARRARERGGRMRRVTKVEFCGWREAVARRRYFRHALAGAEEHRLLCVAKTVLFAFQAARRRCRAVRAITVCVCECVRERDSGRESVRER